MRLSTSWMYQQSVNTMLNQQSALAATQNQVTTQKRINVASDDPAGAGQVVNLSHVLAANAQYSSNIDSANGQLASEQTSLASVTNVLDSARSLALQGISGSLVGSDRQAVATQLSQLRDQLVQLANTTDSHGNALFGGTSTNVQPFVKNSDGSISYAGDNGQLLASIGPQLKTATGDPGSALFMTLPAGNGSFAASAGSANTGSLVVGANSVSDPVMWKKDSAASGGAYVINFGASGSWTAADAKGNPVLDTSGKPVGGTYIEGDTISFNGATVSLAGTPAAGDTVKLAAGGTQDIFSTLSNMISALQNPVTSDAALNNTLNRQIESLDQAQAKVTSTEVDIGGRMNTLQQQQSAYSDLGVTYQSALSGVQDVDVYTAISNLSLQTASLQASQQMFSQLKSMSLFNYIK